MYGLNDVKSASSTHNNMSNNNKFGVTSSHSIELWVM